MKFSLFKWVFSVAPKAHVYKHANTVCDFSFTLPAGHYEIPHAHIREVCKRWMKQWDNGTLRFVYKNSTILLELRADYDTTIRYVTLDEYMSNRKRAYNKIPYESYVFTAMFIVSPVFSMDVTAPCQWQNMRSNAITREMWVDAIGHGSDERKTQAVDELFNNFLRVKSLKKGE